MAICFSGRAGSSHCDNEMGFLYDNIHKYFVEPANSLGYQVDTFCHFWDIYEWRQAIDLWEPVNYQIEKNRPTYLQEEFQHRFCRNHRKMVADLDLTTDEGKRRPGPATAFWPNHWANMFYSIWRVNELKKEYEEQRGFTYNMVVRMRADLVFPGNYGGPIAEAMNGGGHTVFVPHAFRGRRSFPKNSEMKYIVDTFAMGGSHAMNHYADVYSMAERLTVKGLSFLPDKTHKACGTMLGTCLRMNEVSIQYVAKGVEYNDGVMPLREWLNKVRKGNYINPEVVKAWETR